MPSCQRHAAAVLEREGNQQRLETITCVPTGCLQCALTGHVSGTPNVVLASSWTLCICGGATGMNHVVSGLPCSFSPWPCEFSCRLPVFQAVFARLPCSTLPLPNNGRSCSTELQVLVSVTWITSCKQAVVHSNCQEECSLYNAPSHRRRVLLYYSWTTGRDQESCPVARFECRCTTVHPGQEHTECS